MTDQECARRIRLAANQWAEQAKDPEVKKDSSLAAVFIEDGVLLRIIACVLGCGERVKAEELAKDLDTIVRELIPDECWDHLMRTPVKVGAHAKLLQDLKALAATLIGDARITVQEAIAVIENL